MRPATYSNLIQAWNISMNFSLHSYTFFSGHKVILLILKQQQLINHSIFLLSVSVLISTYQEGYALDLALWNGIEEQEKPVRFSLYLTEFWVIQPGLFKNPLLFQAKLSICHAVVSCHKTVIAVSLMWQCWGHWWNFLACWYSDFAQQARLLQWKSHGTSATMWEIPCLSLLISSNTILTSGYIPTPFEISAVYSLTVNLSDLLIICWAIILSTICYILFYFFFFWKVLGKGLCNTDCLSK